jgi:hypothetical protein
VPQGANVSVRVNETKGYNLDDVDLYPHQPAAVDDLPPAAPGAPPESDFLEGPFVKSRSAYARPATCGRWCRSVRTPARSARRSPRSRPTSWVS